VCFRFAKRKLRWAGYVAKHDVGIISLEVSRSFYFLTISDNNMADSRTCEVGVSLSSPVVTEFGKHATFVNVNFPQRKVTELCTIVYYCVL
jgi:hypothetical protein